MCLSYGDDKHTPSEKYRRRISPQTYDTSAIIPTRTYATSNKFKYTKMLFFFFFGANNQSIKNWSSPISIMFKLIKWQS